MRKLISLCAFAALVLCSCSTLNTISYSEYRAVEPSQSLHAVPLVADLQVSESRITYSEEISVDITKINPSEARKFIDEMKSTVLLRAIKHYNADMMVAPLVDAYNKGTSSIVITVTGFPATYKNIRNASKEDSWFIQIAEPKNEEIAVPTSRGFKLFGK